MLYIKLINIFAKKYKLMKNVWFLLMFVGSITVHAQKDENPFAESGKNSWAAGDQRAEPEMANGDPGNPDGDDDPVPVPIDHNLPILISVALGIIVYNTWNKKTFVK